MPIERLALWPLCLAALLAAGCSKEASPPAGATTAPSVSAPVVATKAAPASKARANACNMVTAAEMSAILGGTVTAAAGGNERPPAATECIYESASPSLSAELEVDWGGGDPQVLGTAAGLANGAAPVKAVGPLHGLGERAYTVTADQVFISTQGHLMMIRFPRGSSNVAAKARRIYETAQPRM